MNLHSLQVSGSPRLRGTLMVGLSGTLFGLMGYFGTQLFNLNFSVVNMLFWRFLIATLWISMSNVLITRTRYTSNISSAMKIFLLGALSYSGGSGFYFLASRHIGTGLAMVIFFSFPVFVSLFALASGSWRMNKYSFAALLAVVIGLCCLKGQGGNSVDLTGILLAIIASFCFAAYVYGSKHTTKSMDSGLLTLLCCSGNTLIFLALALYTRTFSVPGSLHAWFYICALAIIATALPIQLLLNGLKYISPVNASILSVLEPVVTLLIGLLFLNESMTAQQLLGVLIVLSGAVLIQFEKKPGAVLKQE